MASYDINSSLELIWYIATSLGQPAPSGKTCVAKVFVCPGYEQMAPAATSLVGREVYFLNPDICQHPSHSVPPFGNPANGPGGVYALTYVANSGGQDLIVQWTLDSVAPGRNSTSANVTLQAAALTAQYSAPSPVEILNPQWLGSSFAFSFLTQPNHPYTVQHTYSLNSNGWQTLTSFSGNGTTMNVTNQNATGPGTIYRVMAQ
jgi:hypothetical protein